MKGMKTNTTSVWVKDAAKGGLNPQA